MSEVLIFDENEVLTDMIVAIMVDINPIASGT